MAHPIRKQELEMLESLSRSQADQAVYDEAILARLVELGLIEMRRNKWILTVRAKTDLLRRKSLKRGKKKIKTGTSNPSA
ncbi:MAG: hypothetical protein ACREO3_12485 [Arenimonas sp.]